MREEDEEGGRERRRDRRRERRREGEEEGEREEWRDRVCGCLRRCVCVFEGGCVVCFVVLFVWFERRSEGEEEGVFERG